MTVSEDATIIIDRTGSRCRMMESATKGLRNDDLQETGARFEAVKEDGAM